MGKKVKSARGEIIDLDLFKIKEQIASNPAPVDVKHRQDFIERRLRRRLKKKEMVSTTELSVEPQLPKPDNTDNPETKPEPIEEKVENNEPVKKTKQRARPNRKSNEE